VKPEIRVNVQMVALKKITPNPWNPNRQTDFIFEKECHSIRTHGFIDPILVREIPPLVIPGDDGSKRVHPATYEIIDGEHRYRAALQLELDKIPVNNLGVVDDATAKQLTIIMNETRGEARRDKMADLLQGLKLDVPVEELYANLPYQPAELDSFLNTATIDWDQVKEPLAEEESDDQDDGTKDVILNLPVALADQFLEELDRWKRALNPDASNLDKIPRADAVAEMLLRLASIPTEDLPG
jgi:ParB/RepB/Spo0J family partition protein